MRVTDIKHQKRDGYFSIFIDNEYGFSLTDLALSNSGLRVGFELSPAEVEQWQKASGQSKAVGYAYRYIATRARSISEMRTYLRRKDFEAAEIDHAIAVLIDHGLLGDTNFGQDWVAMRQRTQPRSKQRLTAELRQKGLSTDDITTALEVVTDDDVTVAIQMIQSKRLLQKYATSSEKLMAYLARQGFGYDTARKALDICRADETV